MRMSWQISVKTALILSTLYKSNYIREYYMNIKYLKQRLKQVAILPKLREERHSSKKCKGFFTGFQDENLNKSKTEALIISNCAG